MIIMLKKLYPILILLISSGFLLQLLMPRLALFYHNRGVDAFNGELHEKGVEFFKRSLYIMPNADTYDYLAHTYEKLGRLDDAVKIYNKIISDNPDNAGAYISLSRIYLESHIFEKAVNILENALAAIPYNVNIKKTLDATYLEHANYLISKSFIFYMTGRKAEAYSLSYNALKLYPDYAYAHYILGYFYFLDNNLDQAMQKMEYTLSIEPDYWKSHKMLGDIFFKKNEFHKAADAYKRILHFNKYDYAAYNDIGISFMNMEDYGQAIIYLEEALRLSPENPDIIFNLASTYKDMGLLDQALLEYNKLSRYDNGYPNMNNSLADIYAIQGRKDLALDAYRKEMKHTQQRLVYNPDDVSELNNLARAHNGIGDCQKAKNIIKKVISIAPDYRDAYITLANIEERQNNLESALQALYAARSLTARADFIDRHILNIKNKIQAGINPSIPVRIKKAFSPSHKIFFKSGKSIEGIITKKTERKVFLYVQAKNSNLDIVLMADDIDRIVEHERQ
jgi:tetratricopeptide (TPR) repeat protein